MTAPNADQRAAVADVRDLTVRFGQGRATVYALNGVSLRVGPGQRVGVVGESGCGKTLTGLSLLGLLPPLAQTSGSVQVAGYDVLKATKKELRRMRGAAASMIFQDPLTSLNPVTTIGEQLGETLAAHTNIGRTEARERSIELLDLVGVSGGSARLKSYPHQLSGGMRQRVMIAMAISTRPKLLVADEPTTALDVTTQAQILDRLADLTEQFGTALVLITHDMGVVARSVEKVFVMYAGFVVESAPTSELYEAPSHPYTLGLLNAVPRLGRDASKTRPIEGVVPDGRQEPIGCPFAPRCAWVLPKCLAEMPQLATSPRNPEHFVACHNPVSPLEVKVGRRVDNLNPTGSPTK